EQPRVLDGDDGLIGKRLENRTLLVRERAGRAPRQGQRADRDIAAHHWHGRVRPITGGQKVARADGQFWRGLLYVGDSHDPTIENRGAGHVLTAQRDRKPAPNRFDASRIGGGHRRRINFIPIREQDDYRSAWKQLQPALDDGVEYRLGIAKGIADDL